MMGMFDSFYLKTVCPYCKELDIREFQTKQFRCAMFSWSEGEIFALAELEIQEGIINGVYGGCNSKKCDAWQEKKDEYKSGFGRMFYCDVLIKNGKIDGATNIRKSTKH